MWNRKDLKQKAKEALRRNYWKAVLVSFMLLIIGDSYVPAATASGGGNRGSTEYTEENAADDKTGVDVEVETYVRSDKGEYLETDNVNDGHIRVIIIAALIVVFMAVFVLAVLFDAFLFDPLIVGGKRFMLKCIEDKSDVAEVTYMFDHSYLNCVKTMFFRELHIFLWCLLFIIPGIYKKYQYYMVEYILALNPDMPYKEVLDLSAEMMEGHKWNAFVLDLSFIGWHILGLMTCGLLEIFYVQPYSKLTRASLFCELEKNNEEKTAAVTEVNSFISNSFNS